MKLMTHFSTSVWGGGMLLSLDLSHCNVKICCLFVCCMCTTMYQYDYQSITMRVEGNVKDRLRESHKADLLTGLRFKVWHSAIQSRLTRQQTFSFAMKKKGGTKLSLFLTVELILQVTVNFTINLMPYCRRIIQ